MLNPGPKYELQAQPGAGFVTYLALAPIENGADLLERLGAVAGYVRAHQVRAILFDVRQVPCGASVAQLYQMAYRDSAIQGFSQDWRYAFLAAVGDTSQEFLETVYTNAGYNARLFTDEAQACAWLTQEADAQPPAVPARAADLAQGAPGPRART